MQPDTCVCSSHYFTVLPTRRRPAATGFMASTTAASKYRACAVRRKTNRSEIFQAFNVTVLATSVYCLVAAVLRPQRVSSGRCERIFIFDSKRWKPTRRLHCWAKLDALSTERKTVPYFAHRRVETGTTGRTQTGGWSCMHAFQVQSAKVIGADAHRQRRVENRGHASIMTRYEFYSSIRHALTQCEFV